MSASKRKPVLLALQGGGAHGAFTWGVLDYLLEDGRLDIKAISGTSAGALNAAAMAPDYANNRVDDARQSLRDFWHGMSVHGVYSPCNFSGSMQLNSPWTFAWPWLVPTFTYHNSPYHPNPYNVHFLKTLINEQIDFESIQKKCSSLRLFVSASNVLNNHLRIFSNEDMSDAVLLASSCLPKIHQAVEIHGQYYWDGGYMGNPSLEPLLKSSSAADVVVVQINPMYIDTVPKSAFDIHEREETLSFNSSLSREIRHIAEMKRLVDSGYLDRKNANIKYLHIVHAETEMSKLDNKTKYDTSWVFLTSLRDIGRKAAQQWLDKNFDTIGQNDSIDLDDWDAEYSHNQ